MDQRESIVDAIGAPLVPFVDQSSIRELKRAALLFDKVTPAFFTSLPRAKRARFPISITFVADHEEREWLTAELDFLHEHGLLDVPSTDPDYTGFELEDMDPERPLWVLRTPRGMHATQLLDATFTISDAVRTFAAVRAPLFLPDRMLENDAAYGKEGFGVAVEVVLNHMPFPDDSTPWEGVFDWRADYDAQRKRRRLINWINSAWQRTDVNLRILSEEVQYLLDEYQQAMAIHDFKARSGTLRTVVTTTAEVVESILKLRVEKLVDMPFQLLGRRIDRLDAEQKAPGRELAYIIDTHDRFRG